MSESVRLAYLIQYAIWPSGQGISPPTPQRYATIEGKNSKRPPSGCSCTIDPIVTAPQPQPHAAVFSQRSLQKHDHAQALRVGCRIGRIPGSLDSDPAQTSRKLHGNSLEVIYSRNPPNDSASRVSHSYLLITYQPCGLGRHQGDWTCICYELAALAIGTVARSGGLCLDCLWAYCC